MPVTANIFHFKKLSRNNLKFLPPSWTFQKDKAEKMQVDIVFIQNKGMGAIDKDFQAWNAIRGEMN